MFGTRKLVVAVKRSLELEVAGSLSVLGGVLVLFISLLSPAARADVGVVLNESLDTSVARITGSGHTAVYFSDICRETPVKLRLCHSGENGSIISNYTSLGEDEPFEWNVVPLNIYLYGVEDARNRPVFGSEKIKDALEERYRAKYLVGYCESVSCQTSNKAEWREMVAASLSRSIYIFVVATTVDQDRALIEKFNSRPNVNHFNAMTRNCANFARLIINTYFPGATHADYINDFGMTSPKAIARSFTRYSLKHPESQFRVLHIAQVPGTLKRSTEVRTGTEQLYRSKKLLAPMLIFAAHELPAVAASYLVIGRFNPQSTWEKYPTAEASAARHRIKLAKSEKQDSRVERFEAEQDRERERVVGTPQEWQEYRWQFSTLTRPTQGDDNHEPASVTRIMKDLNTATISADDSTGALWANVRRTDGTARVGVSASTVLANDSDPRMAYDLLFARSASILKSPKHSRETMAEFRRDWIVLQHASDRQENFLSASEAEEKPGNGPE